MIQSEAVAVVGCLAQEGNNWFLNDATAILAKADAIIDVTPTKVKDQSLGKERYRLLGLMDAFNAAGHKGQRMLIGLFIDNPKEKRINLTSLISIAPNCTGG